MPYVQVIMIHISMKKTPTTSRGRFPVEVTGRAGKCRAVRTRGGGKWACAHGGSRTSNPAPPPPLLLTSREGDPRRADGDARRADGGGWGVLRCPDSYGSK